MNTEKLLGTIEKRAPAVFLSYARRDHALVQEVRKRLAARGIRLSWDKEMKQPGTLMQEIERELSVADVVVFFISPDSLKSLRVKQELQVALHRQVSGEGGAGIVPVILEDTDDADLPPLLRQYSWIDLRGPDIEEGVRLIVKAIQARSVILERL